MTIPKKFVPAFLSWVDDANQPHNLYFDLCMSYGAEHSSEVTTHPVEAGANIADHVRVKPLTLKLEVFTSNTPIEDYPDGSRQKKFVSTPLKYPTAEAAAQGPATLNAYQFGGANSDYILVTYTALQQLHDNHTLLTVTTPIQPYTNMVITDLRFVRDTQASGDAAMFSIDLEQITIVHSQVIESVTVPQAKPAENTGQADTEEVEPEEQEAPRESILSFLGL